jgi:hypothetical protein
MGVAGLLIMLRQIFKQLPFAKAVREVGKIKEVPANQSLKVVVDGHCWIHAAAGRYGREMLAGDYTG